MEGQAIPRKKRRRYHSFNTKKKKSITIVRGGALDLGRRVANIEEVEGKEEKNEEKALTPF